MYEETCQELLNGCKCGSKLFFFIKKSALEKRKQALNLTENQKEMIEKDVCDIMGVESEEQLDHTVVLDFETINVLEPGKFELDLVKLFNKKNPVVYKLEEGKYVIDLAESFKREKDHKDEEI